MSSKCHCGQPLHYSSAKIQKYVEEIIGRQGRFIDVRIADNGRTFAVDRHYLALHGINAAELPKLGFKEVQNA